MKRFSLMALAVIALAVAGCSSTATQGTFGAATFNARPASDVVNNQGCSGTVFGNADLCYDPTNGYATYYNNGGTWTAKGTSAGGLTASTGTFTSTADRTLQATNGGHINSLLGTGTTPSVGTGSISTGGTDVAMEVTGATSPATVTFGTAFTAKPVCQCTNETTAADGCKAVPNSNGQTVVITTASTDSFALTCIGH